MWAENPTLAFMRDIIELKLTEKALRQSEKHFHTLLEKSSEVIILADANNEQIFVSPNVQKILGYTVEEYFSLDKKDFIHSDYIPILAAEQDQALKHPGETFIFTTRVRHRNGNWLWIENSVCNCLDDPSVHAFLISFHDITEYEETKRELEMKSHKLVETNIALKRLWDQRAEERNEIYESIDSYIKQIVLPYIEILKQRHLDEEQKIYLNILEANLKHITSGFVQKMTLACSGFTSTEIKVASLIQDGRTVKEIAQILGVSDNCVNHHRQHIRNKLGLNKQKGSLRSHLLSLQQLKNGN
jgi:PAS domain S-box-containing protein